MNGYIVYNHLHYNLGVLPICMHIQSLVATKLGHLSSAKDGRRYSNEGKSAGPDDVEGRGFKSRASKDFSLKISIKCAHLFFFELLV